jgi:5'-3' exonuclease
MNITIIDLSAVIHSSLHGLFKDSKDWQTNPETNKKYVPISTMRTGLLGSLLYYKNLKHRADECIIAMDAPPYWRKDILPFYKGMRKKKRTESDIDWKMQHQIIDDIMKEFRSVVPWNFISVPTLEADDIMGIMGPRLASANSVIIISADRDLVQLQRYPNIRQWSPITKKFVVPEVDPVTDLMVKVIKGDSGDAIMNVYSDINLFRDREDGETIRQKPITSKMITEAAKLGWDPYRIFNNDNLVANFQRNQMLVDFDYIPDHLKKECIEAYSTESTRPKNMMSLQMYLGKHRMKEMLDSAHEF